MTWQAQYKLKAYTVPQCICDLLNDFEKIEKAFLTEQEHPGKKGKANPCNSNKQRKVLFNKPIPKKPHKDVMHCSLCKKNVCVHATYNTVDLCRYNQDGKLKKGFGKGQCGSTAKIKRPPVLLHNFQ